MKHFTTFSQIQNDILKEKMFFGAPVNIARYDHQKHPILDRFTETQLSFYWSPQEICLAGDRGDFDTLTENERHIFLANLKYQILLDSVQGRSPNIAFLPLVSLPELETWIATWTFFETIHSRSYTHMIRSLVANPEQVFDTIISDNNIIKRAGAITEYYDKLIFMTQCLQSLGEGTYDYHHVPVLVNLSTVKKQLYLTLHSVNALEAIRFYVSFACSFSFAENRKLEGCAKIMRFIARDEALHCSSTTHMINIILNGDNDPEMTEIAHAARDEVTEIFMTVVEQEKDWARYLFKNGPVLGLNTTVLCRYIDFLATQNMDKVSLDYPHKITENPLPWMDYYLASEKLQVAPQEVEIASYLVGQVDSNIEEGSFSGMNLE